MGPATVVDVGAAGPLRWDHGQIIERAVAEMRRTYRRSPDPFRLLAEPFTLRDLQTLHEAVAGERLMRDSFRRRMEPQVTPTGDMARGTVGRPACSPGPDDATEPARIPPPLVDSPGLDEGTRERASSVSGLGGSQQLSPIGGLSDAPLRVNLHGCARLLIPPYASSP